MTEPAVSSSEGSSAAGGNTVLRERKNRLSVGGEAPKKRFQTLAAFDVYTKVPSALREQQTRLSRGLNLLILAVGACLVLAEVSLFRHVDTVDEVRVDSASIQQQDAHGLPISLNVTFPRMPCSEVSADSVDATADSQVALSGALHKVPLDVNGRPVPGDGRAELIVPECGSCFAADSSFRRDAAFDTDGTDVVLGVETDGEKRKMCCNTCDDLKAAYRARSISYFSVVPKAPQCANDVGCRIEGKVAVNKVAGNVHVALGESFTDRGRHVHDFQLHDVNEGFNTTHVVHELRFGESRAELEKRLPRSLAHLESPIEGYSKTVLGGCLMHHYYLSLVPTVFEDLAGRRAFGHQYRYTESSKDVLPPGAVNGDEGGVSGLPGVFFVYDLSPFQVVRRERAVTWAGLALDLCGIVGGLGALSAAVSGLTATFERAKATSKARYSVQGHI